MKVCLWVVVFLAMACASRAADEDQAAAPAPSAPQADDALALSIMQDAEDNPILVVKYPWKQYEKPSIEVCLAPDEAAAEHVEPLSFNSRYMKGKVRTAVYRSEDRAENVPTPDTVKDGTREFKLRGSRNALGMPAVSVAWSDGGGRSAVPHAAFCHLETWAHDDSTLYLELPRESFAKPGTLKVWLFRGGEPLASQTLPWRASALGPWLALAAQAESQAEKSAEPKRPKEHPKPHSDAGGAAPEQHRPAAAAPRPRSKPAADGLGGGARPKAARPPKAEGGNRKAGARKAKGGGDDFGGGAAAEGLGAGEGLAPQPKQKKKGKR